MNNPPAIKPRTYRQKARRQYLAVAKQRRPQAKARRKAVGQQLRYLRRNLKHIDTLLAAGASLSVLKAYWYRRLLVIHEVYRQQQQMYQQRQRRVDHLEFLIRRRSSVKWMQGKRIKNRVENRHQTEEYQRSEFAA